MGFKFDSVKRRDKNAPRKASAIGMVLVFIAAGVSVFLGWWAPQQYSVRAYLPFTATWSDLTIQIVTGVVAFILLQFILVLIQGILLPPQSEDLYAKDGTYIGKKKND